MTVARRRSRPPDHPNYARRLSPCGTALATFFQRLGHLAARKEAVVVGGRQAVAATDHPDCAAYLNNLGTALHTPFERTGQAAALAADPRERAALAACPLRVQSNGLLAEPCRPAAGSSYTLRVVRDSSDRV